MATVYRIRPRPDKIDVGPVRDKYYAVFKLESQARMFGGHMWGKWYEIEPVDITEETWRELYNG